MTPVVANKASLSPSRRARGNAGHQPANGSDPVRHSGDSGDSGVSSPGPPGSSSCSSSGSSTHSDSCSTTDGPSYMDRVVLEVVESEQTYVRDLQQVVQVSHPFFL